jgi:hypothetical protein
MKEMITNKIKSKKNKEEMSGFGEGGEQFFPVLSHKWISPSQYAGRSTDALT